MSLSNVERLLKGIENNDQTYGRWGAFHDHKIIEGFINENFMGKINIGDYEMFQQSITEAEIAEDQVEEDDDLPF
jgi:hypothetical protein